MTPTQETLKYFITLLEKQLMTIDRLVELDIALDGKDSIPDDGPSSNQDILVRALEEIIELGNAGKTLSRIDSHVSARARKALNNYKNK